VRRTLLIGLILVLDAAVCRSQASGNVAYAQSGGRAHAVQNETSKRLPVQGDTPPDAHSVFVDADVLMNVLADEHVAVFARAEECDAVPECARKMDATVTKFRDGLAALGVAPADVDVDYVAQNEIYGYEIVGDLAKEKLTGFELKKNVAVRYRDKDLLDKLVLAAAAAKIFDLVKVDYLVLDVGAVENRLRDAAAEVARAKAARYEALFGVQFQGAPQVYADKPSVYYPTRLYDAYTATEGETVDGGYDRDRLRVQTARKTATFFFNGLDGDGFDRVINPVVLEPVVQFTMHLRLRYSTDNPGGASGR